MAGLLGLQTQELPLQEFRINLLRLICKEIYFLVW